MYTLEFWPFFINIGILPFSFQTFEFLSYFVNHWNSGPILTNTGILILPLQAKNIWRHRNSYIVLLNMWILALCFTHWKFDLILSNIGILRYFYKHCNFYLILPLRSLQFWPCFYRRWNFDVIPPNFAVQAIYTHSNCYLIHLNVRILTLFLYTLVFWSYPSKRWDSCPISVSTGIMILIFQTLEFWSYCSNVWNSCPIVKDIGILILLFHCKHQNSALV